MCLECAYGVLTLRLRTRHNGVLGVTHSALRLAQPARLASVLRSAVAHRNPAVAERCERQRFLIIDEQCRDRCEKLLENLNSCAAADASHGQPAAQSCSTHMARFRDFCVSNSASATRPAGSRTRLD